MTCDELIAAIEAAVSAYYGAGGGGRDEGESDVAVGWILAIGLVDMDNPGSGVVNVVTPRAQNGLIDQGILRQLESVGMSE